MTRLVPKGCPLSQRQYEVMILIAEGCSQRQVADILGIQRTTVAAHSLQAQWVLGAHNQTAAVAAFVRGGWAEHRLPVWRDHSNERGAG